jgi:8-oxo-dGTP pyrophosphatase MutT (NUDIX family)
MTPSTWEHVEGQDQLLAQNWLFKLVSRVFRSTRSGKTHTYFVAELPDCVQVVALTTDGRIILVRQFRAGAGKDSLEIPGGLLEPGEEPSKAGVRELLEETGYAGDAPRVLGTSWCNPSLLNSKVTTILVENAKQVAEPKPDASEELEIVLAPAKSVLEMIASAEIDHALIVGSLLLRLADSTLTWKPA